MRTLRLLLLCCTPIAVVLALIVPQAGSDPGSPLTGVANPTTVINPTAAADQAVLVQKWNEAAYWNNVTAWVNATIANEQAQWYAAAAANEPVATVSPSRRAPTTTSRPSVSSTGSGRCGGNLPSCSVMMCESGGSLTARNRSGAAGKWQIMPGTWAGYGGYSSADQAPEAVQDARATQIYAGGAGRSQWSC